MHAVKCIGLKRRGYVLSLSGEELASVLLRYL